MRLPVRLFADFQLRIVAVVATLFFQPLGASAGLLDCGQPSSSGDAPTTTDARTILRTAVGTPSTCSVKPCICDVSGDGLTNTSDALRTLKFAVGQEVELVCDCSTEPATACTSATVTVRAGSELDYGWTGIAHDSALAAGFSMEMDIVRRCTTNDAVCTQDAQCPDSGTCVATCDCLSDSTCEFVSSGQQLRCLTTQKPCASNADCSSGVACVEFAAPPQPVSSGGTPVCFTPVFRESPTGTGDMLSGEFHWNTDLQPRNALGITISQPCPRCGAPSADLAVGQQYTCEGGQFPGAGCTVDGVSNLFGGTSYDCPAVFSSSTSGWALSLPLRDITTATTTRTAQLPCANFSFKSNPLNAPANPGKCLDNSAACSSNADCRRCGGDSEVACSQDSDCSNDSGPCAEAPDQPVTCGYWCHCGFCDGNGSQPCLQTSDCSAGQTCQVGPGIGNAQNAPQQRPNDCSFDKFICGQLEQEQCGLTQQGKCSLQPYRVCASDTACVSNDAGTCVFEPRSCFEPRITRAGSPSPLASYCALLEGSVCTTNADCPVEGDHCVADTSEATSVALTCMPATASSAINAAGGITGPAALTLRTRVEIHRAGAE